MSDQQRGLLITFEGGEGGGKSTQVAWLKEQLSSRGQEVVAVREPGGTEIAEQIREVVLSLNNKGMCFETEVFLFQAQRAQVYQELIIPSLETGKIVLMDRSRDSSVVYQGMVRGFGQEMIEGLNDISTKKTYPDMTFLLDVDVEIGLQRRAQAGDINRLDKESREFHQKAKESYLELAAANDRGRWIVINADQNLETVQQQILEKVLAKLPT